MVASRYLEAFNGTWAILAIYCAAFLVLHLMQVYADRGMTFARAWCRLPLGVQLALGTLFVCLGVALSRGAIWWWRFSTGGAADRLMDQQIAINASAIIGSIGFLCILRTITRAMGAWPVVCAVVTVAVFLVATFTHG